MLKRVVLVLSFAALAATPALAHGAERGLAKATVAGKALSIEYGRPTLQGRDMFGRATPGEAWRMGADAATTLDSAADLSFGSTAVPKGSYILTATKNAEGAWTLNVRDKADRKKVVADVPLTISPLNESVEVFTIELRGEKDKGELELRWGTQALKAGFSAK